jgi:hypothetical protein
MIDKLKQAVANINDIIKELTEPQEVDVTCPECKGSGNNAWYSHTPCVFCNGDGIQKTDLTKDQAKRLLDMGWIIMPQHDDWKESYFVKHRDKYYLYHDEEFIESESENLIRGYRFLKVIGRAVEKQKGLKFWQALKLATENKGSRIVGEHDPIDDDYFSLTVTDDDHLITCDGENPNMATSDYVYKNWQWTKYNYPVHLIEEK